jgi:hypothetical protein
VLKMPGRKIVGSIIFILGFLGLLVSLLASVITIGPMGASPGFGLTQIVGTILGVIFIAVGSFLTLKK